MHRWRKSLENAFSGGSACFCRSWPAIRCEQVAEPESNADVLLPALVDTVKKYHIPADYLYAVLDGVEMDLDRRRYETFEELQQYCQRVASAVGLACIHIWGFRGQGTAASRRRVRARLAGGNRPATDQHPPRLEGRRRRRSDLPAAGRSAHLRILGGRTQKRRCQRRLSPADGPGNQSGQAIVSRRMQTVRFPWPRRAADIRPDDERLSPSAGKNRPPAGRRVFAAHQGRKDRSSFPAALLDAHSFDDGGAKGSGKPSGEP